MTLQVSPGEQQDISTTSLSGITAARVTAVPTWGAACIFTANFSIWTAAVWRTTKLPLIATASILWIS